MTTTTRLAELLQSYADLVEHGHADRMLDPFEREAVTSILREVADQNPTNQHEARRMAVHAGSDHGAAHSVIVRAIDIVTNIL